MRIYLDGGAVMLLDKIVRRKLIDKGWSSDSKYCSETAEGKRYLLRISPANRKEAVSLCYSRMKEAEKLGISMCSALEWGICDEGVYFIQSWVDGCDAEEQIPTLDAFSQYSPGLAAGRDLRKLHGISAPEDVLSWDLRFGSKIDRKLKMYADSELKYDEDASMISYIMENRHLISGRPQCYQHGDHHIGNMMIAMVILFLLTLRNKTTVTPGRNLTVSCGLRRLPLILPAASLTAIFPAKYRCCFGVCLRFISASILWDPFPGLFLTEKGKFPSCKSSSGRFWSGMII